MKESKQTESFLLSQFHQFYTLFIELRKMAETGTWVYSIDDSEGNLAEAGKDIPVTTSLIFQKLISLFEEQEITAGKTGGDFGSTLYKNALFIMSALADEVFLTMDWVGKEAWGKFLLETKFFGSNAGGDIFFIKLDTLLQERDPVYSEIAVMYLLALSLGFRGKFRGVNDKGIIEGYRQQLFSFVFGKKPDLKSEAQYLFPDAYVHTLEKESKVMIPGLKKWYGYLAALIFSILVTSHIVWINMTDDLHLIVQQILGQG